MSLTGSQGSHEYSMLRFTSLGGGLRDFIINRKYIECFHHDIIIARSSEF